MKVAVIGTGYVGLVSGACLAETGNTVTCVDIDQKKIDRLKDGIIPIHEKGLEDLVKKNYQEKRLFFTTKTEEAVHGNDIIMIAVGTPPREDGSADLNHVLGVAKQIGRSMTSYKLIVTKSTVPVGTGDQVKEAIQNELNARGSKIEFSIASNPEFLKEGVAVADFMRPDRIVIGSTDTRGENMLRELYNPFVLNGHRVIAMDLRSAELCKYASNVMLATKISMMNELSRIAEALGADITQVRQGMGADTRIGYAFTHAGIGYGGSCFPKDVKALGKTGNLAGVETVLLDSVEKVNQAQRNWFIDKIKKTMGQLSGKKIALWGLSFKPETDDIREAPSLDVIAALTAAGALVVAYDPIAIDNTRTYLEDTNSEAAKHTTYAEGMYEALEGADALVLCTEWMVFRSPDFDRIKSSLKTPIIFDGRNQYSPANLKARGFTYVSIGRA